MSCGGNCATTLPCPEMNSCFSFFHTVFIATQTNCASRCKKQSMGRYGLCSRGVEGITAGKTRLVIPRGHDCITCFLGSKTKYKEYFEAYPGTYWYTPGWIENHLAPGKERYEKSYEEYKKKYGEDNAQYLMEMEQDWFNKYSTAAYVDLEVGDTDYYKTYTRQAAEWLSWRYDEIKGDPALLKHFVNGDWNAAEFLIVEPDHHIEATNDDNIMRSVQNT